MNRKSVARSEIDYFPLTQEQSNRAFDCCNGFVVGRVKMERTAGARHDGCLKLDDRSCRFRRRFRERYGVFEDRIIDVALHEGATASVNREHHAWFAACTFPNAPNILERFGRG